MRKYFSLLLVLALALPLALPFGPTFAQDGMSDAVRAGLEAYNANLPAGYGNISVSDLAVELIDNPDLMLVDVRQPEEYAENHIPDAINIPLRDLAKNLDLLPDLDMPIVVYCGSAFRSTIAMTSLQLLGYTDVRNMAGGFRAWLGEEYAVTTEATEGEAGEAPEFDAELFAAVDAQLSNLPEGWGSIRPEDLNIELIENPPDLLIDVRKVAEWENDGYIEGATLMPLEELMSFADEWPEDMDANIVVYCKAGHRGNMAATILRTAGYTNVRNLSGGFLAWGTADLPIAGGGAGEGEAAMEEFDPVAAWGDYIASMPASFNAIFPEDLNEMLASTPDVVLFDVRTADEYLDGHLEGAINAPLIEMTDYLGYLPDLDAPIVVYCGSGHRSAMGMVALNLLGYSNAQSLFGGIKAWTALELPVVTEDAMVEAGDAPEFDAALFEMVDDWVRSIPAGYDVIRADDLNLALIENPPALIDVRTAGEYEGGHIEGAMHIELRDLITRIDEWPSDVTAPVVVYSIGHRSVIAMAAMQMLGYEDVSSLAGGINAWQAAEYPVVAE